MICVDGQIHNVAKKAWDIELIDPAQILIEVQGEQHSSKLNTQPNNNDQSLGHRASLDHEYAQAALRANYSVVWLELREGEQDEPRCRRWLHTIEQAIQDKLHNKEVKLYT